MITQCKFLRVVLLDLSTKMFLYAIMLLVNCLLRTSHKFLIWFVKLLLSLIINYTKNFYSIFIIHEFFFNQNFYILGSFQPEEFTRKHLQMYSFLVKLQAWLIKEIYSIPHPKVVASYSQYLTLEVKPECCLGLLVLVGMDINC